MRRSQKSQTMHSRKSFQKWTVSKTGKTRPVLQTLTALGKDVYQHHPLGSKLQTHPWWRSHTRPLASPTTNSPSLVFSFSRLSCFQPQDGSSTVPAASNHPPEPGAPHLGGHPGTQSSQPSHASTPCSLFSPPRAQPQPASQPGSQPLPGAHVDAAGLESSALRQCLTDLVGVFFVLPVRVRLVRPAPLPCATSQRSGTTCCRSTGGGQPGVRRGNGHWDDCFSTQSKDSVSQTRAPPKVPARVGAPSRGDEPGGPVVAYPASFVLFPCSPDRGPCE